MLFQNGLENQTEGSPTTPSIRTEVSLASHGSLASVKAHVAGDLNSTHLLCVLVVQKDGGERNSSYFLLVITGMTGSQPCFFLSSAWKVWPSSKRGEKLVMVVWSCGQSLGSQSFFSLFSAWTAWSPSERGEKFNQQTMGSNCSRTTDVTH